jgi:gamma-glutamylcyclotransferase (GGCT)/AIG2-like uncharacterized protein YtfP
MARLFVYGSLMRGQPQNRVLSSLSGARRVGKAWVHGHLLDLGDYPGAVLDAGESSQIEGEVWEVDYRPGTFRALDAYEEFFPTHPERSLFIRRKVRIYFRNDATTLAWIYVVRRPKRASHRAPAGGPGWSRIAPPGEPHAPLLPSGAERAKRVEAERRLGDPNIKAAASKPAPRALR